MAHTLVDLMMDSYLETALWSSNDWDDMEGEDNPPPFDGKYSVIDFSAEAFVEASVECKRFMDLLIDTHCEGYDNLLHAAMDLQDIGRIGHDFWLTRNGHGAGFWDGDYGDYGDLLTEVCQKHFSECDLYAENGVVDFT